MCACADSTWDHVKSPREDQIVAYNSLTKEPDASNLNKLAVLKVNGGLGTSMGMH
jgi:UTP--glucose-1-phosphate uridylyltransferase